MKVKILISRKLAPNTVSLPDWPCTLQTRRRASNARANLDPKGEERDTHTKTDLEMAVEGKFHTQAGMISGFHLRKKRTHSPGKLFTHS